LTFIEDGHKDSTVTEDGKVLINFVKRRQQAVVIREIQQYQQQSYHFMCVPMIRDYFTNLHQHLSEEELFKLSLQAEPRESS
jgi:gluconate kinase